MSAYNEVTTRCPICGKAFCRFYVSNILSAIAILRIDFEEHMGDRHFEWLDMAKMDVKESR